MQSNDLSVDDKEIIGVFFIKRLLTRLNCGLFSSRMKEYQMEGIKYGFNRNSRKWHFVVGGTGTTLIQNCGGQDTAHLVAKQMVGSIKRSNKIDGICRSAISRLVSA
jgi:hypothetical protein